MCTVENKVLRTATAELKRIAISSSTISSSNWLNEVDLLFRSVGCGGDDVVAFVVSLEDGKGTFGKTVERYRWQ